MASIKDIAKECQVSIATVSKALNDHTDISETTKIRIREKAKELGYYPNSVARALKTNSSKNIGVLFVEEAHCGLTHAFFSHILDSFKTTAESKGYDITFLNCNKSRPNRMSYLEHCKHRKFDGLMIASINYDDPEVLQLVASNMPLITLDYSFQNKSSIVSNNIIGMKDLVDYIYLKGHRKIAFIHGLTSSTTNARLSSFYERMEHYEIKVNSEYVRQAAYQDIEEAVKQTKFLMRLDEKPTCIIYPDDFTALGGLNILESMNYSVPEDVSVAGYDGLNFCSLIEPNITTIRQNTYEIGKRAALKLISHIEKPKSTLIEMIVIDGVLEKGQSIKKIIM